MVDDPEILWWPNLDAGWVLSDGSRVGWVSVYADYVRIYNMSNEFVVQMPRIEDAAILRDPRCSDWRSLAEVREGLGMDGLTGRPPVP